mmetsp:Transcript_23029/g.50548  ORF Transcript_23029/g.50548 Transcript_23029/m.50548 type:complete len:192 (-) Transcript_23029:918-1493(-)
MSGTRVYIGNLPPGINEREVEDEFKVFGRIRNLWVARKPPGFAFLEYEDMRDADDAIRKLDGYRGWKVELSRRGVGGPRYAGSGFADRGRSSPPRRRSPSPDRYRRRSPSPDRDRRRRSPSYDRERDRAGRDRSRSRDRTERDRRRSVSPPPRERSRSPYKSRSPPPRKSRSRSPASRSPPRRASRSPRRD